MARQQRLVRGNDGFLCRKRRLDRGFGGIAVTAHELDKNIDVRIARETLRVVVPAEFLQIDAAILGLGSRAHGSDHDRPSAARDQRLLFGLDQTDDGRADRA